MKPFNLLYEIANTLQGHHILCRVDDEGFFLAFKELWLCDNEGESTMAHDRLW